MITIEQIESLGFKYNGIVVDEKHWSYPKHHYPIHKFSVAWSQCPEGGRCNDHSYGEYRIFGEVLGKSRSISTIRIEVLKMGGFFGHISDKTVFDGYVDFEQLKTILEILYIRKGTFRPNYTGKIEDLHTN